jgi:phosphate transport system ATP-binding protein
MVDFAEKISVRDLSVTYAGASALRDASFSVIENEILGIIGPANSGKTTFLRTLNRMNDLDPCYQHRGEVLLDRKEVYREWNVFELRKKVGMVFALPTPLPISIFENLAYGPRRHGVRRAGQLTEIVERSLKAAFLWDEVKDRLRESAMKLSGGQQQRLCIARTLAVEPEVILFDEPCSGLDPISTANIEEAMLELKKRYTLILVTNNTKQAARVSDRGAFF